MLDWATGPLIVGWLFVLVWVPIVVLGNRKTHPKALFTLFFAELWERFSFYGMRALLTLYMTKVLFEQMEQGDADAKAYGIYGAFNALLYGAPVIGGVLADNLLGFRRSVIMGGIFMALGQFLLAGTIGMELPFYGGLALIVVGNGFFKPNISSFLGTFYEQDDPRKDGAFTIFYMGINIGAFLAPLTCGYLGEKVDWSLGFLAAGLGIVLGVIVFWRNLQPYTDKGTPPRPEVLEQPGLLGLKPQMLVILGSLCAVPVLALLLDQDFVVDVILVVAAVSILGYLVVTSAKADDRVQGQRLLVVVVLFFFHMIFWALFEQAGASLTLFTERHVDRFIDPDVPGSGIPTSQFQSLNPLYIMLLAPVFSWIWIRLRRVNAEPRTPTKFVLGLAQLSIGYLAIVWGASSFANDAAVVPIVFLCLMYLLHTTGELSLSPVGLSVVTKLAPARVVGFVMGTWFLSIALAHKIAGELGKLTAQPVTIVQQSPRIASATYAPYPSYSDLSNEVARQTSLQAFIEVYFFWGAIVVAGSAVVLLVISPVLKRWMHGIH